MKYLYTTNGITGAGRTERVPAEKASLMAESCGYVIKILSVTEEEAEPFFDSRNDYPLCG